MQTNARLIRATTAPAGGQPGVSLSAKATAQPKLPAMKTSTQTTGPTLHIPFTYSLDSWLAEQTFEIPPRRPARCASVIEPAAQKACGQRQMPAAIRAARVLEAQPRL